jgi:SAM-dependent methyltransferase
MVGSESTRGLDRASLSQGFMKLFRGSSSGTQPDTAKAPGNRLTRRSSGLAELARLWPSQQNLCVLDLGSTSPANITFFSGQSHKIYSEDLLVASTDQTLIVRDEQGNLSLDSRKFLEENLVYPAAHFDVVLCWNLPDYLDESVVKPVVGRLWSVLKPGGMLLAFFHTRDAGPDAPCYRYHIIGPDLLEMQPVVPQRELRRGPSGAVHRSIATGFRLQRVFNNRHIENLFRDFASIKFFLSRDNIREVLAVR